MPFVSPLYELRPSRAPHIERPAPPALFNPQNPCGGGAVAGTIQPCESIMPRGEFLVSGGQS